ncbi:MAG: YqgE/AlgH family protein [Gammaproteobacteria bacterium]|nr:YqgE/AlgH family protein [Gammaproteobacteria bacterium]
MSLRRGLLCALGLLLAAGATPAAIADPGPARGTFLLATAQVTHPMWHRTVILLLEHGSDGTLGVILNRPLPLTASELVPELPGLRPRELRVYLGGPVARHGLLWLLRSPRLPEGAGEVVDGVGYGGDPQLLIERLLGGGEELEVRLFLGHAGWAQGQLQAEIERGDWRVLPADAGSIFDLDSDTQWESLMDRRRLRWVVRPPWLPVTPG